MYRSAIAAVVVLGSLLSVTACGEQSSADDGSADDESGNSALTSTNDFLANCPALEEQEFNAVVDGDAMIKQSYDVSGYKLDDGTEVAGRHVDSPAPASALYSVRFYRDNKGKTKFQFAIGTFAGVSQNIEGTAKRLVGSGTVDFQRGNTYGDLVFTSRRDNLASVIGNVAKLHFTSFTCSADAPQLIVDAPIVTLDKASDETVVITSGIAGGIRVSKSVKWAKKASSAPLAFDVPKG